MIGLIISGRPIITDSQTISPTQLTFRVPATPPFSHMVVFLLPGASLPPGQAAAVYLQLRASEGFRLLGALSNDKQSAVFRVRGKGVGGEEGRGVVGVGNEDVMGGDEGVMMMMMGEGGVDDGGGGGGGGGAGDDIVTLGISLEPEEQVSASLAAMKTSQTQSQSQSQSSTLSSTTTPTTYNAQLQLSSLDGTLGLGNTTTVPQTTTTSTNNHTPPGQRSTTIPTKLLAQRIIANAYNFLASFTGSRDQNGEEVVPLKSFREWWVKFERRVEVDPGFLEEEEA